ncbi:unnamed protein product [Caenorhabditis auriculariae]|uniref:Large ribosomal subunit protein bL32m n=1 Tax=Caenorhabditis auriculariae TaxID=2777116 RepID=A0A8S1H4P8_9PELO|nr:unnamed protein product [Caenorhabditis auriculariae]
MRSLFWTRVQSSLDALLGRRPPPSLGFAFDVGTTLPQSSSSSGYGIREMINDMRIVFGVPKYRTSKPKKVTRKFSYTRLLQPVENLVSCPSCSNIHPSDTICEKCYEKVRLLTNDIKRKMMDYNPYVGEKQDKEIYVKFGNETLPEDGVVDGKRVVELEQDRPSWIPLYQLARRRYVCMDMGLMAGRVTCRLLSWSPVPGRRQEEAPARVSVKKNSRAKILESFIQIKIF